MGINWEIVIHGIACTGIGLWFGWLYYHGKVGLLRMEIQALKRELSDARGRGEAYGMAADEWRGAAMRADAKVWSLKQEKDTEITGLKQKLDDVQARLYAESVDTWIRERRLKRALWLARAERAIEKQTHFALCHNHSIDLYLCINGASMPTERNATMRQPSEWSMIWKKVAIKCQAKAEEYK